MSAPTVVADEPQGTITIEVPEHVLKKMRNQIFQAVDVRNVRGLSQFFGLGEEKPFNVPGRDVLASRCRKNALFFSANYAISAALVGVVTILLNPFFLFVLICLGGFWLYMTSATANETPENPTKIMGRTVTPDQRKLGMLGAALSPCRMRFCVTALLFARKTSWAFCLVTLTRLRTLCNRDMGNKSDWSFYLGLHKLIWNRAKMRFTIGGMRPSTRQQLGWRSFVKLA
uniref:PRA1 family protein n=1 Tax=Hyaloperonospora arabidopsidis (strain Emoy2) TaxID=559515 RepID=M4BI58_HYAAE